jgi:2-C-methyl-D-erythritol 4-phosphate cytidylyltransferase
VVLAGGSGTRLGLDARTNKVYLPLGDRPMCAWSLQTLDADPRVMSIVVAVRAGDESVFADVLRDVDLTTSVLTVIGGPSRSASEHAAFALLRPTVEAGGIDLVVVHDAARPFMSASLLDRVINAADARGAAIPGLGPDQAVYEVDTGAAMAHRVDVTPLRRVQTPQGFRAQELLFAYERARIEGFEGVDTAEVVARFGQLDAVVVPGDADNIKVTTPADVARAEAIASRWPPRPDRRPGP